MEKTYLISDSTLTAILSVLGKLQWETINPLMARIHQEIANQPEGEGVTRELP